MEFSIEKSTVECYKIRTKDGGFAWADITIDAHERGGRIQIASDYGNWSNYWGAAGGGFKKFLGEISHDYAASKFGAERWIDVDASLREWSKLVKEARKYGSIDKETQALILEDIKGLKHENHESIVSAVQHAEHLYSFLYKHHDYPEFEYEANPHFKTFWMELWPVLLAEFAREAEPVAA